MIGVKRILSGGLLAALVFAACISVTPFLTIVTQTEIPHAEQVALGAFIAFAFAAGFGVVVLPYLFVCLYLGPYRPGHWPVYLFLVFSSTALIAALISDEFREGGWVTIAIFAAFASLAFWGIAKPWQRERTR